VRKKFQQQKNNFSVTSQAAGHVSIIHIEYTHTHQFTENTDALLNRVPSHISRRIYNILNTYNIVINTVTSIQHHDKTMKEKQQIIISAATDNNVITVAIL